MSVLVTGATGTVGSVVVKQLVAAGLDVRAFTRSPETVSYTHLLSLKIAETSCDRSQT